MDRIDEFRLLLVVAANGSFSAAARLGNLSPSAVSKIITRIEQRSKIRLFDRNSKSAHPTREGLRYLESLSQVIDAVQDVDTLADVLAREPRGILRVHAGPAFAKNHIAPLLMKFAEAYPEMRLEFRLSSLPAGLTEDIDIAVQFGPLPDSPFIARKLATSRRVLCASPAYIEQHGAPTTLEQLASHKLINYTMPDRAHWSFAAGAEVKSVKVNSTVSSNQAEFLLELALRGAGVARLAEYQTYRHFEDGSLVPILEELSIPEGIFVIFRDRRNLSPRVRVFIDTLRESLQEQPWNLDRKRKRP